MDFLFASESDFEYETYEEVRYHRQLFEKYYKMVTREREDTIREKGCDFVILPTEIVLFINTWPYCSACWDLENNGWWRYRAVRAADSVARRHKNIVAIFIDRKGMKPEGYRTIMIIADILRHSAKQHCVDFHADVYTDGDGRHVRWVLHRLQLPEKKLQESSVESRSDG